MSASPPSASEFRDPPVAGVAAAPVAVDGRRWWRRTVLYPDVYVWFVFLASLDIMCTWMILHLDGREENPLAEWIIEHGGLPGTSAFKLGVTLFVIGLCEVVGRRRVAAGRQLAEWCVALTAMPVVVALAQLLAEKFGW